MIRANFGIAQNPFSQAAIELLEAQQQTLDILRIHCQQGGFCLLLGEPGTGKSVVLQTLRSTDPKRLLTPAISRTMHHYMAIVRMLCQAMGIDHRGDVFNCEKRMVDEAHRCERQGIAIAPVIDDAHLLDIQCLRKLRLLFESFPRNHNLILAGHPSLLADLSLTVNLDLKSRITYSTRLLKLPPDTVQAFILSQFDKCGLGHNAVSEDALSLIARSSEGILRHARNLALSTLLEAARQSKRTATLAHVNAVLLQPHWRKDHDIE